ncbi:uncharacterized protein LOC111008584 [Momordica charantia]|uniref:Uncharacterized protein LOC111008584 n=1 Tax=Momordica charantia TaxID=3673 RepID=A0A6J1C5I3_MOMCH|nr:uncharacterized protein LOC111008584 [Momordica charantia]
MMQGGEGPLLLSLSPSFSSYSSGRFAEIAARVVEEFRKESDSDPDIFDWKTDASSLQHGGEPEEFNLAAHQDGNGGTETVVGEVGDNDEFEFAVVPREPQAMTTSAEDIFYNGQIRPIYPVFNTNLLLNGSLTDKSKNVGGNEDLKKSKATRVHRPSLGKLMSEERESNSCSSSEADELDGVIPGTYCVWSPKESLERCKKSNSMGSSKRWKLRDLLYRSNSDGKDTFVFLAPNKRVEKVAEVSKGKGSSGTGDEKTAGKVKPSRVAAATAANGATEGADTRSQSVPYTQETVDLFAEVNGMNKNSHLF